MINRISQEVTVLLKLCTSCQAELLESDRFCRRCGVNQKTGDLLADEQPAGKTTGESLQQRETASRLSADEAFEFYVTGDGLLVHNQPPAGYATTALGKDKLYRRVSGSLVKAVAASLSAGTAPYATSRFAKRVIPAMILIPIWLLIILLSPLDAYAMAKMLAKQVN